MHAWNCNLLRFPAVVLVRKGGSEEDDRGWHDSTATTTAVSSGVAVSPDGRTILYSRHLSSGSDMMMIDNFKSRREAEPLLRGVMLGVEYAGLVHELCGTCLSRRCRVRRSGGRGLPCCHHTTTHGPAHVHAVGPARAGSGTARSQRRRRKPSDAGTVLVPQRLGSACALRSRQHGGRHLAAAVVRCDRGRLGGCRRGALPGRVVHLCSRHRRQRRQARAGHGVSPRRTCRRNGIREGQRRASRDLSGRPPGCGGVARSAGRTALHCHEGRDRPCGGLPVSERPARREHLTPRAGRRTA